MEKDETCYHQKYKVWGRERERAHARPVQYRIVIQNIGNGNIGCIVKCPTVKTNARGVCRTKVMPTLGGRFGRIVVMMRECRVH